MAETFKYVQGDTGPQLKLTLTEEDTGAAVDLTGATVTLHFRAAGEETVLFSRPFFINPDAPGEAVLQWEDGDLDVEAGAYEGEVEVVRASGVRETLYDKLKFRIREDFA